jgi:hypothetical protein
MKADIDALKIIDDFSRLVLDELRKVNDFHMIQRMFCSAAAQYVQNVSRLSEKTEYEVIDALSANLKFSVDNEAFFKEKLEELKANVKVEA